MDTIEQKTFSLHTNDFEELQAATSGFDQSYNQMGKGKFHGSIWYTECGPLTLFREKWGQRIQYRGAPPPGMTAIAIPLNQAEHGNWLGKFAGNDSILLQVDGQEGELVSAPLWDSIVILIPHALLVNYIENLRQTNFDELRLDSKIIAPRHDIVSTLRKTVLELLRLTHNTEIETKDDFYYEGLVDSVLEISSLALISDKGLESADTGLRNYRQMVRKTEEYCDTQTDTPLRIKDMCNELKVSERTLRHAFRKYLNLSPLEYLKARKMNRIHRLLKRSTPGEFMIKQVAYSNGFYHLGQFCHDYNRLFGELPTHTLKYR